MAETVLRTISIPLVTEYFKRLVPEFSCWGGQEESGTFAGFAGITDAVALSVKGEAEVVIDWKSDVAPSVHYPAETCGTGERLSQHHEDS